MITPLEDLVFVLCQIFRIVLPACFLRAIIINGHYFLTIFFTRIVLVSVSVSVIVITNDILVLGIDRCHRDKVLVIFVEVKVNAMVYIVA